MLRTGAVAIVIAALILAAGCQPKATEPPTAGPGGDGQLLTEDAGHVSGGPQDAEPAEEDLADSFGGESPDAGESEKKAGRKENLKKAEGEKQKRDRSLSPVRTLFVLRLVPIPAGSVVDVGCPRVS